MKTPFRIFLLSVLSIQLAYAEEIRMAASDLLAEFITPHLKAFAEENDLHLTIDDIGSLPAMDRLRANEIDLAVVAFPESAEVPREEFSVFPLAYSTAVLVVNNGNPINELSLSRLGGIFGSSEEFNFNTWGELGTSGWRTRNIKPLAGPAEGSISLELFRHSVLSGRALKSSVAMLRDSEIEDAITRDIASIGILSALPEKSNLKVLMLSGGQGDPAFSPTSENIYLGDYPIRLPFYIAFNPRDEGKVKPILRALLSAEISESLNKNDLFALPETARNRMLVELDFRD